MVKNNLTLETIAKGDYCGASLPKKLVVENKSEWVNLWNLVYSRINPKPQLPKINFNKYRILAVFRGTQSSGGYAINIDSIIEGNNCLKVLVSESNPNSGGYYTMALTQPYHIAKIQKTDKKVKYAD